MENPKPRRNQRKEVEKVDTAGNKTVFAEDAVTVHKVLGKPFKVGKETVYNVESVTLEPGDTFNYEELPLYQQNALLNEQIPGLKLLEQEVIDEKLAERDRILGEKDIEKVEM